MLAVLWLAAPGTDGRAQELEDPTAFRLWEFDFSALSATPERSAGRAGGPPRLRLFRMAPGFISDPLGLHDPDDTLLGLPATPSLPPQPDDGPDWLQVDMGSDTPYFDFRQPGDPGGLGFYRIDTQVQLVDLPSTACTFGLRTVTPAGIQFGGLPDGPTVVSPAFGVFHALNDATAVQGFMAKNVPISEASGRYLQRNFRYGMALQRSLLADGPEGLRKLFFSVGALGQVRPERDTARLVPTWDVMPGLHWHVNDNWWVTGGMLVPVGPAHTAPGQWQFTCSLRF